MAVQKTYSIVIKYERGDAGLVQDVRGVKSTQAALSESDPEYTEIRKIVLARIADVVPVSQGIISANIVGEVSES